MDPESGIYAWIVEQRARWTVGHDGAFRLKAAPDAP